MTTIRVKQTKQGTMIHMKAGKGQDLRNVISALAGQPCQHATASVAVRNPFRNELMRSAFSKMVQGFNEKHRDMFNDDGSECQGNRFAQTFWRGYHNTTLGAGYVDRNARESVGYAIWRAGRACAEHKS